MIDLKNYETWFLLYADDELTAAEKLLVDDFLRAHPQLQADFNAIQEIKFTPEENISFPDPSILFAENIQLDQLTLEPDQSIVYPFKFSLYKRESVRTIDWRIPLAMAGCFLLLIGLFIFLNPKQELSSKESLSKKVDKPDHLQLLTDTLRLNMTSTPRHVTAYTSSQRELKKLSEEFTVAPSPIESDLESIQAVQAPLPEQTIAVVSNFTDEAIKAAESRTKIAESVDQESPSINTELIINASLKSENRISLRGLVRRITRRVLKEDDESDQNRRIQVASFAIPVSNKK
jgi:hypothetical protein